MILAIDPGPTHSAYVVWDGANIVAKDKLPNQNLLRLLNHIHVKVPTLAIEQIKCYGMAASDTLFDTVFWTGRFCEKWGHTGWYRIPRMDIKMHLCHSSRAKDANVRQALIDRLGSPGTKKEPGLTYGVKNDIWAALALAVYFKDSQEELENSQQFRMEWSA